MVRVVMCRRRPRRRRGDALYTLDLHHLTHPSAHTASTPGRLTDPSRNAGSRSQRAIGTRPRITTSVVPRRGMFRTLRRTAKCPGLLPTAARVRARNETIAAGWTAADSVLEKLGASPARESHTNYGFVSPSTIPSSNISSRVRSRWRRRLA